MIRVGAIVSLLLSGCTVDRPLENADLRAVTPVHAIQLYNEDQIPRERVKGIRSDGHLEILAISAGGSYGAFGAGVLHGMSAEGGIPDYDIVTGVSTGALLAALIFAGDSYSEALRTIYTTLETGDVYRERGLLRGILSDALYDYEPLMELIAGVLDEDMLDRIAAEHRKGRRLYVASTNLDGGRLVVWDLGGLAASDRHNRLLRSRKILRASAAVPGFFRPVYLKPRNGVERRQAHVDGGVKTAILLEPFMFQVPADRRSVTIIVNDRVGLNNDDKPVSGRASSVAYKALNEMLRESFYQSLRRGYSLAQMAGAEFRLAAIPEEAPRDVDPLDFDPEFTLALFNIGEAIGRSGVWADAPPRLTALERGIAPPRMPVTGVPATGAAVASAMMLRQSGSGVQ